MRRTLYKILSMLNRISAWMSLNPARIGRYYVRRDLIKRLFKLTKPKRKRR